MIRGLLQAAGLLQRLRVLLTPARSRRAWEASFWGNVDLNCTRPTSWDSIERLSLLAVNEMTGGRYEQVMDIIIEALAPLAPRGLRGLTLGCGDMMGEKWYFMHPALPFVSVDAYDISARAVARAQSSTESMKLNVRYYIEDVNTAKLPPETYDLVVITHSMHHFKRIDHIIQQINRSLKPDGVFLLWDYVGPRYQRFSRRQLAYANMVLQALPLKYRCELDRSTRRRVRSQPLLYISPDEAVRSDRILPTLKRMNILHQYNWAGLLFPLLRGGIAVNFDQNDPEDRKIIDCLFQLDRLLCQSGQIEPNFTITIAKSAEGV